MKRRRFHKWSAKSAGLFWLSLLLIPTVVFGQGEKEKRVPVTFRYTPGHSVQSVAVSGTFNDWAKDADPMFNSDSGGTWKTRLYLPYGTYEYRFLVNGKQWVRDPENPYYGGENSNSLLFLKNPLNPELHLTVPLPGVELRKFPITIRAVFRPGVSGTRCAAFKSYVILDEKYRLPLVVQDSLISLKLDTLSEGFHRFRIFAEDKGGRSARPVWSGFVMNRFNRAPMAGSGPTAIGFVGEAAPFNAGYSFDPDMDPLKSIFWKILQNDSTLATLLRQPFPGYSFGKSGKYRVELKMNDSFLESAVDTNEAFVFKHRDYFTKFMVPVLALHIPKDSLRTISLVGEFNDWKAGKIMLSNLDSTGFWETKINLPPGEYEYKFVINGKDWVPDPMNPRKIPDGWNGYNSLRTVQRPPLPNISWKGTVEDDSILLDASASYDPMGKPLKIAWIPDRLNPEKLVMPQSTRTKFAIPQKNGAYFVNLILSAGNRTASPQTILIKKRLNTVRVLNFQSPPAWGRDAVIYELYVRKFSKEGNLIGVKKNLKYLSKLGINTIWLMPIFESPTRHGYNPTNFRKVLAEYGTNADLLDLVKAAHKKNIRIMLDFIANHTSDQHPYFKTAYWNTHSMFRDWFIWHGRFAYDYYNDWDAFPNLNYKNPNVWHFMLKNALFWAKMEIDGYRCDVAWGVPHSFWKAFRRTLKSLNPDFLLLDEVLPRSPAYHKLQFDMSYDTDFYGNLLDVLNGKKPIFAIDEGFRKTVMNYPPGTLSLRYLENHDLKRFRKQFGAKRTRLAAVLLFTIPGTPLIYYGQEFGSTAQFPDLSRKDEFSPWFKFYRKLIKLRRKNRVFTQGELSKVQTDLPQKIYAYLRQDSRHQFLVVLNFDPAPQSATLLFEKGQLLVSNSEEGHWVRVMPKNSLTLPYKPSVKISLPGYGYAVFQLKKL